MKNRKILSLVITILIMISLVGCTKLSTLDIISNSKTTSTKGTTTVITSTSLKDGYFILPDLNGKTTDEVKEYFENSDITNYVVQVKNDLEYGDEEGQYKYGMFYGYAGQKSIIGSSYSYSKKLTVYVTAYELESTITSFIEKNPALKDAYDAVTLSGKQYENQSFIETGCGEVTVTAYVDGDTTRFKDKNGTVISLRYLGVDTPESTAAFEPWGKAASAYTESCLSDAKRIVLEAEQAGQQDSNKRYLGWVWYLDKSDVWHLLNLEQILFCYTKDKADSDSIYGDLATSIGTIVGQTGRRVWGEHDPNYDYSTDPKEITIQELRTNFAAYYSKKVKITGIIAMVDGSSAVIVDEETNYGIFFYIPSWNSKEAYDVTVGNKVTIIGVATYYGSSSDETDLDAMDEELGNGSPQLTDFKEKNITVISEGNSIDPVEMTISNVSVEKIGMYVTFKDLTVTRVSVASTGSGYTVYCKDSSNKTIGIRVDNSHFNYKDGDGGINSTAFSSGQKISSVTGYLSYYYGYQITVTGEASFTFNN